MKLAWRLLLLTTLLLLVAVGTLVRFEAETQRLSDPTLRRSRLAEAVELQTSSQQLVMGAEELHAEYDGDFVVEGWGVLKATAEECRAACQAASACNVWVYCPHQQGCSGRAYQECWLKHSKQLNPAKPEGRRHSGIAWQSGAKFSQAELSMAQNKAAQAQKAEHLRLDKLRTNDSLPLVYFDVAIKGKAIGRMQMVLFSDVAPRAAENFRALCTGEKGIVPEGHEGAGKKYHFQGAYFYRIIDQFIDQSGAETESVFGGQFDDDPGGLQLKHDRRGLLSCANAGPNTNTSHFSILMAAAPHLDGSYTIFGEVVSGFEVAEQVNALSRGRPNNTAGADAGAQIVASGQLR